MTELRKGMIFAANMWSIDILNFVGDKSVYKFKLGHKKKNWTQWATIGDDSSLKHILTFEKPYRIKHLFVSDSCTYSVSAKIRNLTYALCAKQVEYDADQVDCQCTAYYWLISVVRN